MGWMELLVVGVVALIVVGPKDLPVMFQALGRITAKVKRMAREFQMAMSDAAKASGTSDVTKDLKELTSPKTLGLDRLKSATDSFDRWDPITSEHSETGSGKNSGTSTLSEERADQTKRIRAKTAQAAQARLDREAEGGAEEQGKAAATSKGENTVKPSKAVSEASENVSESQPVKPQKGGKPAAAADTTPSKPRKPVKRKKAPAKRKDAQA